MNSKIKNVCIFIIAFIICIVIGIYNNKVFAVDKTVYLTSNSTKTMNEFNLASASSNFFCIQEGQPLDTNTKFTQKKHEYIVGDNEVDYRMCWIAYQKNTDSTPENSKNPNYSVKQRAIYGYFGTWAKEHGWNDVAINSGGNSSPGWDEESLKQWKNWQKAKNANIKNSTVVSNLKKELYNYNGQTYIKVGPFNFTYSGYNPDVVFDITNQNGTKLSALYGVYNGSNLKISSGFQAEDYSGKDCYLFINANSNVTSINLKVNLTDKRYDYVGDVYLYESDRYVTVSGESRKTQNVIYTTGWYTQETTTDSVEMRNILITGELEVIKQDKDTGAALNNVGFVLYNTQLKKYVAASNSNGIPTYTSNRSQAKEFITGVNGTSGKITVTSLLPGKYDVYETKNPNFGYGTLTGDKKLTTIDVKPRSTSYGLTNDGKRTLNDGYYEIQSALNSNMVVEVQGGKSANSTNVQLYSRNNSAAQQFYVQYLGDGYYVIRSNSSYDKVLDVKGGSTASGTNVQIYHNNNSTAQRWTIRDAGNGYYYIINQAGGKYLDVQGGHTANGTNIQVYNGNNRNSQKFKFNSKGVTGYSRGTVKNEKIIGNLKIVKKDADNSNLNLSGVSFKIRNSSGQYIIAVDTNGKTQSKVTGTIQLGNYKTTTNINSATEFVTDSNGTITINNLIKGNYQIVETKMPNYGYTVLGNSVSATVTASKTVTTTIKNTKQTGNMRIQKRDATNSSAMSGISFKIKNSAGQYIIAVNDKGVVQKKVTGIIHLGNMQTTTNANNATEFVTNSNGVVEIYNIKVDTYQVIETSLGNKYYGYALDGAYVSWSSNKGSGTGVTSSIYVNRQTSTNTGVSASGRYDTLTVKNRRKYVKISGYVWEDVAWDDGKNQQQNQLYQAINDDKNDKLLNNIVVRLKDSSGSTVKEVRTNSSGKYTLNDVLIDNLGRYYIEFSYNGMAYESVDIINISNNRGTKAIEGSNRTTFNGKFAQITTGQSNNSSGTKTNDIRYNTGNYTSTINYEGTYQYGYDASQVKYMTADEYRTYYPVNGVASKYLITSSTYNAYKSVGKSGYLSDIISASSIRQNGTTEIGTTFTEGINLGLKKREMPDLSVVKDIDSATVNIVGTQHVYKYGDRFNPDLWAENSNGVSGHELDPKVKFEEKYAEMSYSRALYASDVYYTGDQGDPLSVYLTYKIGVRNNSTGLNAVIYELDDYFDAKYNLVAIGTDINADGSIKSGTQITNYTAPTNVNSEYKKMTIGGSNRAIFELSPLEEKYIYVQLQVNRSDIIQIVENSDSENSKLDNITEIKKYGITKTNKNGVKEIYAGIDKDSQPGNTDINDRTTWEDDTDKAPGMLLVLQQAREVNGKVFLDTDENPVDDGQQVHTAVARQGNGQYDNDEKGIENVKVTLVDQDGNIAKVYNESSKQYEDAVTYTNENGEYTLDGFIPGEYEVQYTWGGNVDGAGLNSTYTLDSGEEEIVNVQNYKSTVVDEDVWNAKGTNEKWYNDNFKRNYPGLEWNTSSNTEIRASDAVDDYDTRLAIDSETGEITYSEKQKLENTYDSTSTEEKYTNNQMNSSTQNFKVYIEYGDTADGITNAGGNTTNYTEDTVNRINSVDFGIIERARQVLQLNKHITAARITLANGNVLVNARLEDGQLVDQTQYVAVTPHSPGATGMVRIEVDQEIIQSATVEIEYGLEVTNISELEYQTEEFYMYGTGYGEDGSKLVTLQPGLIIDYLDNNLATDMSENAVWDSIAQENRKSQLIDTGLLSESLEDILSGTSRVITTDEAADQVLVPLGIEIAGMNNTSSIEIALSGYKLLSNTGDETFLENNAEIIRVIKNNGGGTLITTPGNYNPSDSSTSELDNSTSESLVILPPTGLTTNYIAYTLLAISSLGILVAGVILIKKFVIK